MKLRPTATNVWQARSGRWLRRMTGKLKDRRRDHPLMIDRNPSWPMGCLYKAMLDASGG